MSYLKKIYSKISVSDVGRRMAKGTFWSFTGTALAKVIVLVAGILCAHVLTKSEYGKFGMVRSTINMFVILGSAGLGVTATKYISEYLREQKERIPSIFLLTNRIAVVTGLVVTVIVLWLAPVIATKALHDPSLVNPVRMGAVLLFVTVLNAAQNGTLSGLEDFRSIALNTLYGSLAESVFMLLGAWLYGVMGAILGFGVGYIVLYICNRCSIKRVFRSKCISTTGEHVRREDWSLLYKFSLPAVLSSLMITPAYWLVRTILVRHCGFEELAIYEAADQWRTIALFIPNAVCQVVLPILSSMVHGNKNDYWHVLKLNLLLNTGIAMLVALVIVVFSPFIMELYGSDYGTDYTSLAILAASSILTSASNVVGMSISSKARMWAGFGFNLFWSSMLVFFSWYFIVCLGMGTRGIAWALLLSYTIHTIIQLVYLRLTK